MADDDEEPTHGGAVAEEDEDSEGQGGDAAADGDGVEFSLD